MIVVVRHLQLPLRRTTTNIVDARVFAPDEE